MLQSRCTLKHSPQHRRLVVLGFADPFIAADHVPAVLKYKPIGLEGFDGLMVDYMLRKQLAVDDVLLLPEGRGFLLCEFGADSAEEADRDGGNIHPGRPLPLARRAPCGATPMLDAQARLAGARIRPGRNRLRSRGKAWMGGLGGFRRAAGAAGQLSARDLPAAGTVMGTRRRCTGTSARAAFTCASPSIWKPPRASPNIASSSTRRQTSSWPTADRCPANTETGNPGRLCCPKCIGPELMKAFQEFKALWDPENRMNPGKMIDPVAVYEPVDNLRLGAGYQAKKVETWFQYQQDPGGFGETTLRCVGVGACRKQDHGTMCPSYMATREEKHSTRGRAHLLWEMLQGDVITDGWRNEEVKEALDLCLSCKACKTECPVNVDMATWKAEFLGHHYQGRVHPLQHYLFGFMDRWAHLAANAPGLANLPMRTPGLRSLVKAIAGVAPQRELPQFARRSFQSEYRNRAQRTAALRCDAAAALARYLEQLLSSPGAGRSPRGARLGWIPGAVPGATHLLRPPALRFRLPRPGAEIPAGHSATPGPADRLRNAIRRPRAKLRQRLPR